MNAAKLRDLLRYDPETGALTWRTRGLHLFATERAGKIWNTRCAGQEAGAANADDHGYRIISIWGRKYRAHRVAWALHYGEWPKGDLDHEDGDRSNNRIKNLRETTALGNQRNMKRYATNGSGRVGVHWRERQGKWNACINVKGQQLHLGTFDDFDAACRAREDAEKAHGFHPNHGR